MTDQPTPADDDFVARLRLAHHLQVFSGGGPPTPPSPSLGELLDELGVKLLPPDDPVYQSGAYVFFSDGRPAPQTRVDRPSRLDAIQPAPPTSAAYDHGGVVSFTPPKADDTSASSSSESL